ncbi:MAG: hypothetical protein KJ906_01245 [Nanoarchaeota archaeon]|nr:hypothetical protein [Nanoarchaeota archaeon]
MSSKISPKVIEDFYTKDKGNVLFWLAKTERYSKDRTFSSCLRAGTSEEIARKISNEIDNYADSRVKMSDIRPLIYALLQKYDSPASRRFKAGEIYVSTSMQTFERFDRVKIAESIVRETELNPIDADRIAFETEKFIKAMNIEHVSAPLIREIVNVKLLESGYEKERALYTRIGMPVYDVTQIINRGSKENANLQYNPETIHKIMADRVSKEYTLTKILPKEMANAHMNGSIHIHDMDYFFSRPFCFSHDVRFFLKHGFKPDGTGRHTSIAGPAKNAEVAFLHAAKILAASQTNCAGGQGFSFFNTFMAPAVSGLSEKQMKQLAQMFIYEMSIDGEEEIPVIDEENEFRIFKIKDFVDNIVDNSNDVHRYSKSEIVKTKNRKYKTLSFDENGTIKQMQITGVSRHKASDLYEIRTNFGKKISLTGHHSVFTFNGEKIVPVKTSKLKHDDFIVGIKNIDFSIDKEFIDIYEELKKRDYHKLRITNIKPLIDFLGSASKEIGDSWFVKQALEGKRTISFKKLTEIVDKHNVPKSVLSNILVTSSTFSKKKYYLPLKLSISDELLRLIGYYVAEGYTNSSDENMGIGLGIDHNELIKKDAIFCVKHVFGSVDPYEAEEYNLRFGGKLAALLFRDILGLGEHAIDKKIPSWLLALPKEKLSQFLKSYVNSDGYVSDSRMVGMTTSSKKLLEQLRFAFLRFGLVFKSKIFRKAGEEIIIKGVKTKANEDSNLLYICDISSAKKFLDQIGFVNEKALKLENIIKNKGVPQTPDYMLAPFNGTMTNVSNIPCNPLNHDLFLEKITSIKKLDKEIYVYDLEIEETQNFISISGIALHNSQMYVARGGQVVFSSIDLDMHVPNMLKDIPIIGLRKSGATGTYGDYEDETRKLFNAFLDVFDKGDWQGKPFNFPKFEVQMDPKDLAAGRYNEETYKVSSLAAKFGTPYYIIKQPYMPEFSCYQSIPGEEKILILRDDRLINIEIGEYVESIMKKSIVEKGSGIEGKVKLSKCNDYAISFDTNTLEIKKTKIEKVMKHETKEKIFKLILDGNRTFSGTEKHKIPVVRNNKISEIRMEDVKKGDYLIGAKNLPLEFEFDRFVDFNNKKIEIDAKFARLLGYFASEGYMHIANKKTRYNKISFSFNIKEKEYIDDTAKILKEKFGLEAKFDISEKNNTNTVYVYSKELVELFDNIGTNYDAKTKRVPKILMTSPWYIIKDFMLGMFRGDGSNSDKIDLHLCNRDLIDDIFVLGLRIGVPFDKYHGENSHSLRLTSNLRKSSFLESVPFSDNVPTILGKSFDSYERVPVNPFDIKRENLKTGHWNRCQIGKRVTEKRLEMNDELYSKFIRSDLHLFEVKKIEEVKSRYVYDLINVEKYHNFLTSDGIFSSNCCAYLMPLDKSSDADDMLNGTVRGGSLQVVTLNLPQIAYESDKEESRIYEIIDERLELIKRIMILRKDLIEKNLQNGMLPFMSQIVNEKGDRYLEPLKQSYTIGHIGFNEMVKYYTGSELHESQSAWMFGLKIMKYLKTKIAALREETGLNFALARTPAESTGGRLAMIDKRRYPNKVIYQGNSDTKSIYYTNSFHVRPDANVPLFKRLQIEGSFHPLTDGGAMSHIWLADANPDPDAITQLTKNIATKTAIQYFAFTKDLAVCDDCGFVGGA